MLDWSEVDRNPQAVALFKDLLSLRRTDSAFSAQNPEIDGAVICPQAFLLRYLEEEGRDRLIVINLGGDTEICPVPEPLLAEPAACEWRLIWSSEDPKYGGLGTPTTLVENQCRLPAHSALVFAARPAKES
jgi:maltooligosyltrehalose trehalohydrolase